MHEPAKKETNPRKANTPIAQPAIVKPIPQTESLPIAAPVSKLPEVQPGKAQPRLEKKKSNWLPKILWGISGAMLILMALVVVQFFTASGKAPEKTQVVATSEAPREIALPIYNPADAQLLKRLAEPKTIIPERSNVEATTYVVQSLDSIFGIANDFKLKPESILWANYDTLHDDPQTISVGLTLYIPPTDGVYYQWQDGDTLDAVAGTYHVDPSVILNWPGNHLDLTNPVIQKGQYVMIPGGRGEFKQWVVPVPYVSNSGTTRGVSNQCKIPAGYPYASGGFIWPTAIHAISGNDFWEGHHGIDIGGYLGDAVFASDSGVVVFAGSMSGGYGNVIIIEHDWANGTVWHTVYAHLSAINVTCGQGVYQGAVIGAVGSSGNSTGPHLHFEIRENGMFINPHQVLP
jgi:murein DD-endopeptidase MepM/ murein hydrolase activator NlpD